VHVHAQASRVCTHSGTVRVRVRLRVHKITVTERGCLTGLLSHPHARLHVESADAGEMRQ
jgi:hypothetical protein